MNSQGSNNTQLQLMKECVTCVCSQCILDLLFFSFVSATDIVAVPEAIRLARAGKEQAEAASTTTNNHKPSKPTVVPTKQAIQSSARSSSSSSSGSGDYLPLACFISGVGVGLSLMGAAAAAAASKK